MQTQRSKPALSLGVIWYLTEFPDNNKDGSIRSYLKDYSPLYRDCDPELFEQMKTIEGKRLYKVSAIQSLKVLPLGTLYYSDVLSFDGLPGIGPNARKLREEHRSLWFEKALKAMRLADVVFLDPDNGLQVKSAKPYHKYGPKYVSYCELSSLLEYHDKSIIIYQHAFRTGNYINDSLKKVIKCCEERKPFALKYRRGTQRAFIVVPCQQHHSVLLNRAQNFIDSKWQSHFEPKLYQIE